uniref:Ribonuclease H-like domain-containing protein n=1 Tax=Tanacetum cinerariifolium TaxID=118510 RepID=A0A6L2NTG9_TANCI|nr:ribonuclease H-like domain-containing protein [Tanacetum cinerariifolium]
MSRWVLLRCDSMGYLSLAVTMPSLLPISFRTSQHTWHQQLGHPGSEELRHLKSLNFISCNKEKPLVLCHACQLGKQEFSMTDLGSLNYFLSMFVACDSSRMFLSWRKYANEILEQAHMALENQLLSVSLLICLGKHDCVEKIPSDRDQAFPTYSPRERQQPLSLAYTTTTTSIFSSCYLFRNPFSSTTMRDENHIRTFGYYSKPRHEGYKNTIDLPIGNNMVPLRSDTIRTAKLRNDILMCQQHHEESLSESWTRFKALLQNSLIMASTFGFKSRFFYDHVNSVTRRTIDQSTGGKLRDRNTEESWALLEDLTLYDNKSWNDPRDFAKLVMAITLP